MQLLWRLCRPAPTGRPLRTHQHACTRPSFMA